MFDFLKKIRRGTIDENTEKISGKPKKDKTLIAILFVFAFVILFSIITNITDYDVSTVQKIYHSFKFSVFDGIILGVITLAYLIIRIKRGRKL